MKFSHTHEWVRSNGHVGIVGISAFAKKEFGEIVHVELPQVGRTIKAGEEVCVLESTKSATDVYSPVSGKIIAVNEPLKSSCDLINQSPEKEGWLFQIELAHPSELENLLSKSQYTEIP